MPVLKQDQRSPVRKKTKIKLKAGDTAADIMLSAWKRVRQTPFRSSFLKNGGRIGRHFFIRIKV
jgi:hypothetical protein